MLAPGYELFLLSLQLRSVEWTLPHARAATSKTFSYSKEGVLYTFLAVIFGSSIFFPKELSLSKAAPSCV